MATAMRHRGPDEEGFLAGEPRAPGLALGVRRLSIIDLTGGHQPIWNETRDVAVVFNGELYNYRELRERLVLCGHRFSTKSDTEVLAHAWEEWGEECLTELRGMFARGHSGADAQGKPFGGPKIRIADVTDGTSNTLLMTETLVGQNEFQRYDGGGGWSMFNNSSENQTIQPINWPIDKNDTTSWCTGSPTPPSHSIWNWHVTWGAKSNHTGGANFAFVDGSVHFISQNVNHQTYQYLGCRNDGQVVVLPF